MPVPESDVFGVVVEVHPFNVEPVGASYIFLGSSEHPKLESLRAALALVSVDFMEINEPPAHVDFTSAGLEREITVFVLVYTPGPVALSGSKERP